jgi:carotenoid cleavage dioxygenase-like enzyme
VLTSGGRRIRGIAFVLVLGGLLAGTAWGQDDHFPFGPFRMYSTSTKDEVTVLTFRGTTEQGEKVRIHPQEFGLRRAELDGQVRRLETEPGLIYHIVESYESFNPQGHELRELRVVYEIHPLDEQGRPVGLHTETVATWER